MQMRNKTLQEKGATTQKRKTKPKTQTTNNKVPFQTTNKIKRTKRVRLVTRRTSSCRIHSTTHHNRRRRGHREGERVHLQPYIVVTAPVFHFDTSWLNADADSNTARREKGATGKRKTNPTTQTTTTTKSRFKPQPKTRTTRVRLWWPRNLELSQHHTTITEGAVATESERVYMYTYWIP